MNGGQLEKSQPFILNARTRMHKKEIRASFRQKRINLTRREVARMEDLLLIQAQQARLPNVNVLMSYMADFSRNEPDPTNLVRWLRFTSPGVTEVLPRIQPSGNDMDAVIFEEGHSVTWNQFGIAEPAGGSKLDPEEIDLILIPMLAFDLQGYRVGYGKGYYDRFLHQCRRDCLKVGLSFFEPLAEIIDLHSGDVRLDLCITPERIYQWPISS
jgi:5-formyltetrahydrofolate cyclo-ligase